MKKNVIFFIFTSFLITLLSGLVYVSTQQVLRQGANDPQIQVAEDISTSLNGGKGPETLFPPSKTDIRKSLSTFVIVYDGSGKPIATSGLLDKKTPVPPKGVFDFVKENKTQRLTWEPSENIREATVIVKYNKGFVLAARSLREIEKRENLVFKYSFYAWIIGVSVSAFAFFIVLASKKK